MDNSLEKAKLLDSTKSRERRIFDNEKLLLYNYLGNLLKMDIEDLVILSKTIFILVTTRDYENIPYKFEIKAMLKLLLDKMTFLVPLSHDLVDLLVAIYEKDYIENIYTQVQNGCVHVKITLKPELKTDFFYKYKKIFGDISTFFKKIYEQEFKFQFM